jgi:hypothetical protein
MDAPPAKTLEPKSLEPETLPESKTYDLSLSSGPKRFVWRIRNRGVTLGGGTIGWTYDGTAETRRLNDIAAVNLQSVGSWQNAVQQCSIAFTGGTRLVVSDAAAHGLPTKAQSTIYRDFVRDLHAALRAHASDGVRYTAGYGEARYRFVSVFSALLGFLLVAVPAVLFFFTITCTPTPIQCDDLFCTPARECPGATSVLAVLGVGAILLWPLWRMVKANAPRTYSPEALPEDLLR